MRRSSRTMAALAHRTVSARRPERGKSWSSAFSISEAVKSGHPANIRSVCRPQHLHTHCRDVCGCSSPVPSSQTAAIVVNFLPGATPKVNVRHLPTMATTYEIKIFSAVLSEAFPILTRIKCDIITNIHIMCSCEVPLFLSDLKKISWHSVQWEPSWYMRKDGRTDIMKLTVAFRNSANAPKNQYLNAMWK